MNTERGSGDNENMIQMPRYQSHKKVWALKIKSIIHDEVGRKQVGEDEIVAYMIPEDSRYAPIGLTWGYINKHKPKEGGYYVVYEDGYKSWSPAEAFEGGYSREETKVEVSARKTADEKNLYNPTCVVTGERKDLQMFPFRNERGEMTGWLFLSENLNRDDYDFELVTTGK